MTEKRMAELVSRLEAAILRLEDLGLKVPEPDPEAVKAAEEYIEQRKWDIMKAQGLEVPE